LCLAIVLMFGVLIANTDGPNMLLGCKFIE